MFDDELSRQLKAIRAEGLYRDLREADSGQGTRVLMDGKRLLGLIHRSDVFKYIQTRQEIEANSAV